MILWRTLATALSEDPYVSVPGNERSGFKLTGGLVVLVPPVIFRFASAISSAIFSFTF